MLSSSLSYRCCLCFIMLSLSSLSQFSGSAFSSETLDDSEAHVVHLDTSNFTDFVAKQKFIAIKFYAPWCSHCQELAPEWEKAAKILSENEPPLVLAKVDASDEKNMNLAVTYEVRGLPTVKILRFGGSVTQDYRGSREAPGIVEYVKKQSGPPSVEIKPKEDADASITDKKLTIVGVFSEFSGVKFDNFTTLAERMRADIEFHHTTDAKILPRGDSSVPMPFIRLFKPFDELFVDFQEFEVDVLEKLVGEASTPLVTTLNRDPENEVFVGKFFETNNSKVIMFVDFKSDNIDAFKLKYREVAEQFKGKGASFLIGDVDENSQSAMEYFGLKEEQLPLAIIQAKLDEKRVNYLKSNMVPGDIPSFLKDFVDGKLQPYKKSEPIPEVNNEAVKVVVGASLEDMVLKSEKNVMLEFYSPECSHCQKLAPIYDEVAVSFQDDADVVVAKIDATANDFPRDIFGVRGLPALFLKAASGKMSEYEGDRSKEDIISFIQKNKEKTGHKDEL